MLVSGMQGRTAQCLEKHVTDGRMSGTELWAGKVVLTGVLPVCDCLLQPAVTWKHRLCCCSCTCTAHRVYPVSSSLLSVGICPGLSIGKNAVLTPGSGLAFGGYTLETWSASVSLSFCRPGNWKRSKRGCKRKNHISDFSLVTV